MYLVQDDGTVIEINTDKLNVNAVTKYLYTLLNLIITQSQYDEKEDGFVVGITRQQMSDLVQARENIGG